AVPGAAVDRPDRPIAGGTRPEGRRRGPGVAGRRRTQRREPRSERRQPGRRRPERLVGVLELVAVARRQAQRPEGEGIDAAGGDVGDPLDVAGGLRHLLAADLEELTMDPDTRRRPADDRRRLGDLVLVLW